MALTRDISTYFSQGCGRCKLTGTPECKVQTWRAELIIMRRFLLDCGLTEEVKWGSPCYTIQGKNIVMLGAFKEKAILSFLKGALIRDEAGILEWPGENSQSAKVFKIKNIAQFHKYQDLLKAYVFEAMEPEKSGVKVPMRNSNTTQEYPLELVSVFEELPAFKLSFEALTPGRRRAYLMYFNSAKQAKTKEDRIEKCRPLIEAGKGLHD